jgi:peptidoglycan/LPS O-acetylase OafA/YrhL
LAAAAQTLSISAPLKSGRKFQSLDGLRAIAALLVIFHHLHDYFPILGWPTYYLSRFVQQGWIGVDLFFVLSGFLITGILIDTRAATNYFSGFYARRVLRIFPLYYLVLVGLIATGALLTWRHVSGAAEFARLLPLPQDRWTYFCFLTNWIGLWKAHWDSHFASILAHFWSLAIEEQFYLVWPFMVWLAPRRAVPWIAGTLALVAAVVRGAWAMHFGPYHLVLPISIEIQLATICRLDGLFLGAIGACIFRNPQLLARLRRWLPWIATLFLGAFVAVVTFMVVERDLTTYLIYGSDFRLAHPMEDQILLFSQYGGLSLMAVGFGALVLLAAATEDQRSWMQRLLQSRILAPFGKYSYGMYVYHVPLLGIANLALYPRFHPHALAQRVLWNCSYIGFIVAASFAISAVSYEFFEKKILRFKRHFEARYPQARHPLFVVHPRPRTESSLSTR